MNSPYAAAASPRFDAWFSTELASLASDVAQSLGRSLQALVLGGGYGRGEGGIVQRDGLERPYNDLDLFVFADNPRSVPHERLERLAARYSARLGVDVDFSRPYRSADIGRWQPTLMWYDLVHGHCVLSGPDDLLRIRCPHVVLQSPPVSEGLRLLLNRGAGLLWARRIGRGIDPAPDADFVRRNYYKCTLALGDALLIAHHLYDPSLTVRAGRLSALVRGDEQGRFDDLLPLYQDAARFKATPDLLPRSAPLPAEVARLADAWTRTLLRVETLRTGRAWQALDDYLAWQGLREPAASSPLRRLGHMARHLRSGLVEWRHPREALYRQLPTLLVDRRTEEPWARASEVFLTRWRTAA